MIIPTEFVVQPDPQISDWAKGIVDMYATHMQSGCCVDNAEVVPFLCKQKDFRFGV